MTPLVSFYANDVELDDAPPPADDPHGFSRAYPPPTPTPSGRVQVSESSDFCVSSSNDPYHLVFRIDAPQQILWGKFIVGSKSGVIQLDEICCLARGEAKSFAWRAEHVDTGDLEFRCQCEGAMEFDGQESVEENFNELTDGENVEF